ncbi:hypothetical protein N7539_008340 [Penicillium diatomitis]|uniref:Uncharacterized protein n=1 Tax=Penicillium diatomitis TaxID=2819901 RepID=A0A9X0BN70_9EURO|nr:uncharacterized protein N7539_008340 [Penicillium diatomitis]KAJ5475274.1 hypothetical protein N7539_008340 [Penicillium diatomitis]
MASTTASASASSGSASPARPASPAGLASPSVSRPASPSGSGSWGSISVSGVASSSIWASPSPSVQASPSASGPASPSSDASSVSGTVPASGFPSIWDSLSRWGYPTVWGSPATWSSLPGTLTGYATGPGNSPAHIRARERRRLRDAAAFLPGSRPALLTLPAEIRNKIYEQVLVADGPITPVERNAQVSPQLLRVNKQIYAEARGILYGDNVFALDEPSGRAPLEFLEKIGPDNAALVRAMRIRTPRVKDNEAVDLEAEVDPIDVETLTMIRLSCLSLKWLYLAVFRFTREEVTLYVSRPDPSQCMVSVRGAAAMNTHLVDIAFRAKIVVETCSRCHNTPVEELEFPRRYGWHPVDVTCERCGDQGFSLQFTPPTRFLSPVQSPPEPPFEERPPNEPLWELMSGQSVDPFTVDFDLFLDPDNDLDGAILQAFGGLGG